MKAYPWNTSRAIQFAIPFVTTYLEWRFSALLTIKTKSQNRLKINDIHFSLFNMITDIKTIIQSKRQLTADITFKITLKTLLLKKMKTSLITPTLFQYFF